MCHAEYHSYKVWMQTARLQDCLTMNYNLLVGPVFLWIPHLLGDPERSQWLIKKQEIKGFESFTVSSLVLLDSFSAFYIHYFEG